MSVGAAIDWPSLIRRAAAASLVVCGSDPARVSRHCVGLAYLAMPYAAEVQIKKSWQIQRSVRVALVAQRERARLWSAGVIAVCPMIDRAEMAHASAVVADVANLPGPLDGQGWQRWASGMLHVASIVVVPASQGWDRCPDVWADVTAALSRNVPVHLYAGGAA